MKMQENDNLPVSHGQMAGMLGMAKETLSYYCRLGRIPRPHRMGNCYYYTADEARQIVEWWGVRKKLVFKQEGEQQSQHEVQGGQP